MNYKRHAYILSPNEMCRPPLLWWLEDHGFDRHRDIFFENSRRGQVHAVNRCISAAIQSGCSMAVFCEGDAIPHSLKSDKFFTENRFHVQCVKYDTGKKNSFDDHDSFHCLIWRASRESLIKMANQAEKENKTLCWEETTPRGDQVLKCHCTSIAYLAKQAGLTVGWMGNAGHIPKENSGIPELALYK